MRVSVNVIFTLIASSALGLHVAEAERGAKSAKNRWAGEEPADQIKSRAIQGENKDKVIVKGTKGLGEEHFEFSHGEPRKSFKAKQKNKWNMRSLESSEEEKEQSREDTWNKNFKNHKNNHVWKDAKTKFVTLQPGTRNEVKDDLQEEEVNKNKFFSKKFNKEKTKIVSVDIEGLKEYLKSKNDKNANEIKKFVKKTHERNEDSNEDNKLKIIGKNKHLGSGLKSFENVKNRMTIRPKPKRCEAKEAKNDDEDDNDDTEGTESGRAEENEDDDESTETEESVDDDGEFAGKDSLQCDSLEKDCDYY